MYLGIDLGTSNSAVVGNTGGSTRIFKSAEGGDVLPSVLYMDKRGHKFVGARAYDQSIVSPENAAHGFKRLMGTSSILEFTASGARMTPEEASADIIRTLVSQARTESGITTISGTVVTIPAAFNQMQSEATIRAARAAGLDQVGLLQEPIAAAMAAISGASSKNGMFLVYDLGGGTFDAALVQSVKGAVNILAHEGINMLGGRDFDRALVNNYAIPWLHSHFKLPETARKERRYQRLFRVLQLAAEKAKIELTSKERAVIFVSEDEARATDDDGRDIFIEVPVTSNDLAVAIGEGLDDSVTLCRKMMKENGVNAGDIDRLVLIGGPSKMPIIRNRIPTELGLKADTSVDPMTAVAIGAAIFAESRDWSSGSSARKSTIASQVSEGPVSFKLDYQARSTEGMCKLRVSASGGAAPYGVRIDSDSGWSSGNIEFGSDTILEIPLSRMGENKFKVVDTRGAEGVFDFTVVRSEASAAGIPATQTIAVKVLDGNFGDQRNVLEPLVQKGTLLPAKGVKKFRAGRDLDGLTDNHIDLEVYQQAQGVAEPELNLSVGSFRIHGPTHLEAGEKIRRGDEIIVRWEVNDNGLLTCSLDIPTIGRTFETDTFYSDIAGHKDYDGEAGVAYAASLLAAAQADVARATEVIGQSAHNELAVLSRRLARQTVALKSSNDADLHRSIAEEARLIRQSVSRLRNTPENRAAVASRDLADIVSDFDLDIRKLASEEVCARFDELAAAAAQAIRRGAFDEFDRINADMFVIKNTELLKQPGFLVYQFNSLRDCRKDMASLDRHDSLVAEGERLIDSENFEGLRKVIFNMFDNLKTDPVEAPELVVLASLMRG